jgi:hypothetical protein
MPGSENVLIRYLYNKKNIITLKHIGKVLSIKVPHKNGQNIELNESNINTFSSNDSSKKADIYINDIGVSVKEHNSFLYNRIQRKNILSFFEKLLGTAKSINITRNLDNIINQYHISNGDMIRNVDFIEIMDTDDFYIILKYLMLEGSPMKTSKSNAELILINNKKISSDNDISVFTYDEFFDVFKNRISFALRRVWYGQKSSSEGKRAKSIISNADNSPWVFNDVKGEPRTGWDSEILPKDRKTCYLVFIEMK